MERKTLFKVLGILFIPVAVYVLFNWSWILEGIQALDTLAMVITFILFILLLPFLWFAGIVIQAKFLHKISGTMTPSPKQAIKIEKRIEFARKCINEHRMTDPIMMSNDGREMVILRHEPSPSREDATQWDMLLFTTTEERANWNPVTGIDGIPHDKLFYVITNSMTGESYLMRFDDHDKAQAYFKNLWQSGVKKVEASEFEKKALGSMFEEKGKIAAHDDKKDEVKE